MSKEGKITIVIAVLIVILGGSLMLSPKIAHPTKIQGNSKQSGKNLNLNINFGHIRTRKMNYEQKKAIFEEWKRKNLIYCANKKEAEKILPFALKLPKEDFGEFKGIYIYNKENILEVMVYYIDEIDGISLHITKEQIKMDFKAMVKSMTDEIQAGYGKSDSLPQNIKINGYEGWAIEPGYNVAGFDRDPRPGFVEWIDHGYRYSIFGTKGDNGTSLYKLMKIAESMY